MAPNSSIFYRKRMLSRQQKPTPSSIKSRTKLNFPTFSFSTDFFCSLLKKKSSKPTLTLKYFVGKDAEMSILWTKNILLDFLWFEFLCSRIWKTFEIKMKSTVASYCSHTNKNYDYECGSNRLPLLLSIPPERWSPVELFPF